MGPLLVEPVGQAASQAWNRLEEVAASDGENKRAMALACGEAKRRRRVSAMCGQDGVLPMAAARLVGVAAWSSHLSVLRDRCAHRDGAKACHGRAGSARLRARRRAQLQQRSATCNRRTQLPCDRRASPGARCRRKNRNSADPMPSSARRGNVRRLPRLSLRDPLEASVDRFGSFANRSSLSSSEAAMATAASMVSRRGRAAFGRRRGGSRHVAIRKSRSGSSRAPAMASDPDVRRFVDEEVPTTGK